MRRKWRTCFPFLNLTDENTSFIDDKHIGRMMGRKKLLFPHLNHEKNLSSLLLYSSTLSPSLSAAIFLSRS
ncbi:MAG: hypothetical protein ACI4NI_09800, partial [Candidatus Ornithospirochaeta sp.]